MGKSKKRIFNKTNDMLGSVITRNSVVLEVLNAIRTNNLSDEIKNKLSLFGITAEELSEAGASFEELSAVKSIIL